jgi:Ni/Co efflux regulator RcnB
MAQTSNINGGWIIMKSMLMAIMAVAVAVTFSAPAFAGEEKDKKDEKKGGHVLVYGDEKKDEKKKDGKFTDTFGEEKKDEKKKDGK